MVLRNSVLQGSHSQLVTGPGSDRDGCRRPGGTWKTLPLSQRRQMCASHSATANWATCDQREIQADFLK